MTKLKNIQDKSVRECVQLLQEARELLQKPIADMTKADNQRIDDIHEIVEYNAVRLGETLSPYSSFITSDGLPVNRQNGKDFRIIRWDKNNANTWKVLLIKEYEHYQGMEIIPTWKIHFIKYGKFELWNYYRNKEEAFMVFGELRKSRIKTKEKIKKIMVMAAP